MSLVKTLVLSAALIFQGSSLFAMEKEDFNPKSQKKFKVSSTTFIVKRAVEEIDSSSDEEKYSVNNNHKEENSKSDDSDELIPCGSTQNSKVKKSITFEETEIENLINKAVPIVESQKNFREKLMPPKKKPVFKDLKNKKSAAKSGLKNTN